MRVLEKVLDGLMATYKARVPDVLKVTEALIDHKIIERQADIENDHIAFRTMGVPNLGIASFEKIFKHYGYTPKDTYDFKSKKLNAQWYMPPSEEYPRVFISELRVNEFSKEVQDIITSYTNEVKSDPVDELDLDDAKQVNDFLHAALWKLPSLTDYRLSLIHI